MGIDPLSLAIQVGLTVASMALTASRKIEGPRLDSTKFTGGDYGTSLDMIWGKRRGQKPIFWAEDLKEVKQRRKTKGGKYNDYTYYGTWAVALAGHEIAGVTRVWFDTHLVLDLTGAGPVSPFDFGGTSGGKGGGTGTGGLSINDYLALYLGTETQEADPRILATTEAKHGEGSCPAYRGTAYIAFKDVPLEKLGNRIPQVSVEVVSVSAPAYPYETFDTLIGQANRLWGFTFSTDYSRLMWVDGTEYEIWDVAARARMVTGTFPVELGLQDVYGMLASGGFYAVGSQFPSSGRQKIYLFGPDGMTFTEVLEVPDVSHIQQATRARATASGSEHWLTIPWSSNRYFYLDGVSSRMSDLTGSDWTPYEYFADDVGAIWAVGRTVGTGSTTAYLYRIIGGGDGPAFITIAGLPANGNALDNVSGCYASGALILAWSTIASGDSLYRIDPADGSVTASRTGLSFDVYNFNKQFANLPPGATSIWLNDEEVSLTDFTTIRTVTLTNWLATDANGIIYDPTNHALITFPQFDQEITWRYLDRLDGDGVTLGSIAADVAEMVGVESYDFTALDQVIPGWSATRGQASNMLEPLFDAYDSDVRPHDFELQGVKRAGVSGGTLATSAFARKDSEARYTAKVRQAAELPLATVINFADVNGDQQPNSVRSDRPLDATDARGEKAIDLTTLALTPDAARQLADRHFRRIWNERREVTLSLTAQQLALEPADVRTLELDGQSGAYRCVKVTVRADDVLATEWKYDHPAVATLGPADGAAFDGRDPSVIIVPLISKGFVLDVPLLADVDSETSPVVYIAAAPYADGAWPGATVYQAIDGEYSEETGSIASSAQATWGYVSDVLPDANPNLWDRGSSVNVVPQVGTLTGTTEAAIDANPRTNQALLGDEILNFTTATLETDGSYTLSGLKRGRRGTEWATGTHAARDVFLLLDTADSEALGLSEVGTDLTFKAITSGRTEAGTFPISLTPFSGASLKPYAPCHLAAVKDSGSGDWALSWVRRTRVGGAWTSGTSIPLSEASEAYEVEILNGSTVVRTVTGLTSAAATYTDAQQVTDFGSTQSTLSWRVYQISDAVDRGFVATA